MPNINAQRGGGSRIWSSLSLTIAERAGSIRWGPAPGLSHPLLSGVAPLPSARDKGESNERELSPLGCKTLSSGLTGLWASLLPSRSCSGTCNRVFVVQFGQLHGSGWHRWSSLSHHDGLWMLIKVWLHWEIFQNCSVRAWAGGDSFIYNIPHQ